MWKSNLQSSKCGTSFPRSPIPPKLTTVTTICTFPTVKYQMNIITQCKCSLDFLFIHSRCSCREFSGCLGMVMWMDLAQLNIGIKQLYNPRYHTICKCQIKASSIFRFQCRRRVILQTKRLRWKIELSHCTLSLHLEHLNKYI